MAIYDTGTASLAANGQVTGVGTQWTMPLTLIRVGATIIFKTSPIKIYTISEITSDTSIAVYNPNNETVPAGTGYAILAHDGISVQGLAQDVAETLRYYQSKETSIQSLIDFIGQDSFDWPRFEQLASQSVTGAAEALASQIAAADSAATAVSARDTTTAARDATIAAINNAGDASTLVTLAGWGISPQTSYVLSELDFQAFDFVIGGSYRVAYANLINKPADLIFPDNATLIISVEAGSDSTRGMQITAYTGTSNDFRRYHVSYGTSGTARNYNVRESIYLPGGNEVGGANAQRVRGLLDVYSKGDVDSVSILRLKSEDGFKYIGWVNSVSKLPEISDVVTGDRVFVKSYYSGGNVGGGIFEYDASKSTVNDGAVVFNGWVRKPVNGVYSTYDAGIIGDGSDVISVATSRLNALASAMTDGDTLKVHGVITVNTHIAFLSAKGIKVVGCGSNSGKAVIKGDKASWYFKGYSQGGIDYRGILHFDHCPSHEVSNLEIIGVQSVKFDSQDPQNDADAGISGTHNDGSIVRDCNIHKVGSWGVFYLESSDVTVTRNTIYDCSRQSGVNITTSALTTYSSARCKVTYNRIYNCGLYAVEAESQGPIEQLQVDNNIISGCTRGVVVVQRQPSSVTTSLFCNDNVIVDCSDAYATSYTNASSSNFRVSGGSISRCANGFALSGGFYDIRGVDIDGAGFNGVVQHSGLDNVLQVVDSNSFYVAVDSTVHTGDIYIGNSNVKYTVSSVTNVNVTGWVTTTYLKKVTLTSNFSANDVYEGARFKQAPTSNPTVSNGVYTYQAGPDIEFRGRLQNCSIRNVTRAFAGSITGAPASQHFFEYNQVHSCDYYIYNEVSANTSWYFANNSIDGDTSKNLLFNAGNMISQYQLRPSCSLVVRSKAPGTGSGGANYFTVSSGSRRYYQINVRFYGAAFNTSSSANLVLRLNGNAIQSVTATSATFANSAVITWNSSNGVLLAGNNYLDLITSVGDFSYTSYEVEFLFL